MNCQKCGGANTEPWCHDCGWNESARSFVNVESEMLYLAYIAEDERARLAGNETRRHCGQASKPKLSLAELVILIATERKAIVRFKAAWRIG